jgi:adenine C2-methylase RlmN of 23S rRNA A2503 and tRNA A37
MYWCTAGCAPDMSGAQRLDSILAHHQILNQLKKRDKALLRRGKIQTIRIFGI